VRIPVLFQKTNDIDWSKYWEPQLYIDNVVGEPRETTWHTVMFDAELRAFVFEKRRIAGTFVENLELYQFPFDTQVDFSKVVSNFCLSVYFCMFQLSTRNGE